MNKELYKAIADRIKLGYRYADIERDFLTAGHKAEDIKRYYQEVLSGEQKKPKKSSRKRSFLPILLIFILIFGVVGSIYAYIQYKSVDDLVEITAFDFSGKNICAMSNLGDVWCWGINGEYDDNNPDKHVFRSPVQIAGISQATEIAVADDISCATVANVANCWKNSDLVKYRDGDITSPPITVTKATPTIVDFYNETNYRCLKDIENTIYCGKINLKDYLIDNKELSGSKTKITNVDEAFIEPSGSCVLKLDNSVWCWSHDVFEHDTLEQRTPKKVAGLEGLHELVSGASHNCFLLNDGTAWCWGGNHYGQLGTDGSRSEINPDLQLIKLDNIINIEAGGTNTCAITADRKFWCWGRNNVGQLFTGTTGKEEVPTHKENGTETLIVAELEGVKSGKEKLPLQMDLQNVKDIFIGGDLICVILESGTVKCWGENRSGIAGSNSTADKVTVPTEVHFPNLKTSLTSKIKSDVVKQKILSLFTSNPPHRLSMNSTRTNKSEELKINNSTAIGSNQVTAPQSCTAKEDSIIIPPDRVKASIDPNLDSTVRCVASLPDGAPNASGISEIKNCSNPYHCGDLEYKDKNGDFQTLQEDMCSINATCVSGEWKTTSFSW